MKKSVMLGMVLVCAFQAAMASTTGRSKVQETINREVGRARAAGEFRVADATRLANVSGTLTSLAMSESPNPKLAKLQVSPIELRAAVSKTVTVGGKTVSLLEIGNLLETADQTLRTQNLSNLSAAEKAHLNETREAIRVSAAFLALASRTSRNAVTTEVAKLEVAAFEKQLSLIEDMITKMDTADLRAHTEVMRKAIEMKTSANVNGDQAFAKALSEGKSQEDYIKKLKELVECV